MEFMGISINVCDFNTKLKRQLLQLLLFFYKKQPTQYMHQPMCQLSTGCLLSSWKLPFFKLPGFFLSFWKLQRVSDTFPLCAKPDSNYSFLAILFAECSFLVKQMEHTQGQGHSLQMWLKSKSKAASKFPICCLGVKVTFYGILAASQSKQVLPRSHLKAPIIHCRLRAHAVLVFLCCLVVHGHDHVKAAAWAFGGPAASKVNRNGSVPTASLTM